MNVERFLGFFQPKRANVKGVADVIFTELATILQGDKENSSYSDL